MQKNKEVQLAVESFLQSTNKPLIIIGGPTASGKTDLSISLAEAFNGEVINADSRQLFRGMEIGANVAPESERRGIPHHLLTFLDPDQVFTLSEYQQKAFEIIDDIFSRKKIPFLVGGTGLYINAVALNYNIPAIPPDYELRKRLEQKLDDEGFEALLAELRELDPEVAENIQPGKTHFLIRALEIAHHAEPETERESRNPPLYDCFYIFMEPEMDVLRERIKKRVNEQLQIGLLNEVRALIQLGYDRNSHAMNGICFKEVLPYLDRETTLDEAKADIIRNNAQYARRQKTWFRGLQKKLPASEYMVLRGN